MHNDIREAEQVITAGVELAHSPLGQFAIDHAHVAGKGVLYAMGPLFKDAQSTWKDFNDRHNIARTCLYAFVVVLSAGFTLYYSITSGEFRGVLGYFATTFGVVKDSDSITISTYAYLDYLITTYVAAAVTDIVMGVFYLKVWGDREFNITKEQVEKLVAYYRSQGQNISAEQVEADFRNRLIQLRNKHFAPGATREELIEDLRAMMNKAPEVAQAICDDHSKTFHDHLERLPKGSPKQRLLSMFKRMACNSPSLAELGLGSRTSGLNQIPRDNEPVQQSPYTGGRIEFPTYGALVVS